MASVCTPENITSLANQILGLEKPERRKLIVSIDNPGLLEFAAKEILERALERKINPHLASDIDNDTTQWIKSLRGQIVQRKRKKIKK